MQTRLFSSWIGCLFLCLACALFARAEAAPVNVTFDTFKGTPFQKAKDEREFKKELEEILSRLVGPDDPPIIVVVTDNTYSREVKRIVDERGAVLIIDPGIFAFAKNSSELAGILSREISKIKPEYGKALRHILGSEVGNSNGFLYFNIPHDPIDFLEKELQKDHYTAQKKANLRLGLFYAKEDKKYKNSNAKTQELIDQAGIKMTVSDETKEAIRTSQEAISRLVKGGYDPWGILTPTQKIGRMENELRNPLWKKIGSNPFKKKSAVTENTEIQFMKNYLMYLEQKKVDITQQPFRGQPLPKMISRLRNKALLIQTTFFGPMVRDVLGMAGTTALGTGALVAFDSVVLQNAKDIKTEVAFKPVENGNQIQEKWEMGRELLERMGKILGEITGPVQDMLDGLTEIPLVKPIGEFISDHPLKTMFLAGLYMAKRELFDAWMTSRKETSAMFGYRFRKNIENQMILYRRLDELLHKEDPSMEEFEDVLTLHKHASDFIEDGLDPKTEKIWARALYQRYFSKRRYLNKKFDDKLIKAFFEKEILASFNKDFEEETSHLKLTRKEKEKLFNKKAYEFFFVQGKLSKSQIASNEIMNKSSRFVLNEYGKRERQKFLFLYLGGIARAMLSKNTESLVALSEKLLKQNLTKKEKDAWLEGIMHLQGMDVVSDEATSRLHELIENELPIRTGTAFNYHLGLIHKKLNSKKLNMEELVDLLQEFSISGRHNLGFELLMKEFPRFASYGESALNPEERKKLISALDGLFRELRVENINENISWASGFKGTYLANMLFLKMLSIKDPRARLAVMDYFNKHTFGSGILKNKKTSLFQFILNRHLKNKKGLDLLEELDFLHEQYELRDHTIAEYLLTRLKSEPQILSSTEDIYRCLEKPIYWKKFGETFGPNWQAKILRRYKDYSGRYEPYSYDPNHSEATQKILMDAYEKFNPKASLSHRLDFWKRLASRGATGLSDQLFDKAFQEIQSPEEKKQLAGEALEKGLVWDQNLRTELFKLNSQDTWLANKLSKAFEIHKEMLLGNLESALEEEKLSGTGLDKQSLLYKRWEKILADFEKITGRKHQKLYSAFAKKLHRAGEKKDPSIVIQWLEANKKQLEPLMRKEFLASTEQAIRQAFPEMGYAYINLLDWTAKELQVNQEEAYWLRDKIKAAGNNNEDLGYSVINEIVEGALHWNKAERWKFLRWLRGSGPPPQSFVKQLTAVGPDTVRRLYATLPIYVRQFFMGTLLATPGKGLLEGADQLLYKELILDEILPRQKEDASIAQDLLQAFLKSVEKISHPEKRKSVLAYLLANHVENSNIGVVLRNTLEAYGLVGVKLGQALAASDILPIEIRKELAKLRDQSKEPLYHEVYERLEELLNQKKLDGVISLKGVRGSASVKYTVKAEDQKGQEHALQIKREEAEAAISRDFKQLEIIIADLIGKSPKKYAFLRGMVEATKAAIWRELSLVRESQRSDTATQEYEKVASQLGVEVDIPKNTDFVKELPGPKSKYFYLRSAEFVSGNSIEKLPVEQKIQAAKEILSVEQELLFPEDGRETHFDPDRHPGNNILELIEKLKLVHHGIDWGQLLKLTQADRVRVARIMAYSKILESVGANPSVLRRIGQEFGFSPQQTKALGKALNLFFPVPKNERRSSIEGYYYLLSELENAGFERNILHYDLIKGIYQLEVYESILTEAQVSLEKSPKKTLSENVRIEAEKIVPELSGTTRENLLYALRHPRNAYTAWKNQKNAKPLEQASEKKNSKARNPLNQPEHEGFFSGVAQVYGAELINAVFWSIYDRDHELAKQWLSQMFTLEKHLGFGSFAVASSLYKSMTSKIVPMSFEKLRYANAHGFSMAAGMIASDIAHRLYHGQPFSEILDQEFSPENLQNIGFSTLSFMAAEKVVEKMDKKAVEKGWIKTPPDCRGFFAKTGRMALVFIVAEGMQKAAKPALEAQQYLTSKGIDVLRHLKGKYMPPINERLDEVKGALDRFDQKKLEDLVFNKTRHQLSNGFSHSSYYVGPDGYLWLCFFPGSSYDLRMFDKYIFGQDVERYRNELLDKKLHSQDRYEIDLINEEIEKRGAYDIQLGRAGTAKDKFMGFFMDQDSSYTERAATTNEKDCLSTQRFRHIPEVQGLYSYYELPIEGDKGYGKQWTHSDSLLYNKEMHRRRDRDRLEFPEEDRMRFPP